MIICFIPFAKAPLAARFSEIPTQKSLKPCSGSALCYDFLRKGRSPFLKKSIKKAPIRGLCKKSSTKHSISHVLFLCTANGDEPRTPGVIIYLQGSPLSFSSVHFQLEKMPLPYFGFLARGVYRVPLYSFPNRLRHCGTFKGLTPYPKT